jgi:parallel beta-helix repeat protein
VRCVGFRGSGVVVTAPGAAVAQGITIRDCDFTDLAMHGFLGYFARRILIEHCTMTRMGRSGTIFARCWDVTVRDCAVRTTGWHGIEVGDETEGFLIEGNRIEDSGDHAGVLAEQAAHDGVITHNQIRNPRFQGIQLNNKPSVAAVKNVIVSENAIWMPAGSERNAIHVYGDTTFTVDDCTIQGNLIFGGKRGIELHYLVGCKVADNTIRNAACGVELHHVRDTAVTGNLIAGCTEEALRALPYAEVFRNSCLRVEANTLLAAEGSASPAIFLKAVDGYRVTGNVWRGFAKELATEDSGILQ